MSIATATTRAWAAQSAASSMAPHPIDRREPLARDVVIEILYCGVCHTDIHFARNDWNISMYPLVPGHEIVGRVIDVGSQVSTFRKGDLAAVGCLVDSCRTCPNCDRGLQQFCTQDLVLTYNSVDKHLGGPTFGGYSEKIVVDEAFVLTLPQKLDPAAAAPLLCAGITTYSPLRAWNAGPGMKVGVVGLGGLGHMGVKFARAFGAHVVLFTTSPKKVEDGLRLGAHEVVVSTDSAEMGNRARSFDLVLDTVSGEHDINLYLGLLKVSGTVVLVGVPPKPLPVSALQLAFGGVRLAGSLIGGLPETQEMLNFCAEHNIASDIEMVSIQQINEVYERLLTGDVRYRFVIDMASLKA